MHENSGVTFEVFARPWNSTLRDIAITEFSVTSIMVARIKQLQYNVDPSFMEPRVIKVTTMINLIGLETITVIPLWIIVLAICFGLLILFLIVVCLWKLGFFVRKRPPASAVDRQPLNDSPYAYRKGADNSL
jgi:integrin alpha 5